MNACRHVAMRWNAEGDEDGSERRPSNADDPAKRVLVDVIKSNDADDDDGAIGALPSSKMDSSLEAGKAGDTEEGTSSLSYKYVMEIIDQHVFIDEDCAGGLSMEEDAVRALCQKAFVDAVGMDMFLQILDDKRGRDAVLVEKGFDNMAIAMKVLLRQSSVLLLLDSQYKLGVLG
jgi:hypothetical protein